MYPIRSSSCALVNRNTVLTLSFSRTLPNLFDNSLTPQAMSDNCFLVSSRECVAWPLLVPADLSAFVSSLISCKWGAFALRDMRPRSRRWCTKHAVLSRPSAAEYLANGECSVVTREDRRRWELSASNTTYLDTSAGEIHKCGKSQRPQVHADTPSHWRLSRSEPLVGQGSAYCARDVRFLPDITILPRLDMS